jgi:hypothetical protein
MAKNKVSEFVKVVASRDCKISKNKKGLNIHFKMGVPVDVKREHLDLLVDTGIVKEVK